MKLIKPYIAIFCIALLTGCNATKYVSDEEYLLESVQIKSDTKGFDAAVADMEVGQVVDIHLMPEEAYGMPDPNAIFTIEIAQLPGSENLTVGQQVYLSNQYGQPFPVKVTAKEETTITFDANHEMAGKELNFTIELVEVK